MYIWLGSGLLLLLHEAETSVVEWQTWELVTSVVLYDCMRMRISCSLDKHRNCEVECMIFLFFVVVVFQKHGRMYDIILAD